MDNKLILIEQKQVVFYEDEITAVLVDSPDGRMVYVPIRPICDFLGINWDAQRRRVNRDAVLSTEVQGVVVTTPPSETGRGGGPQEMTCLPLKFVPGWLFGINADRVKSELKEKIIRYQRECYDVLAEAFHEGRLTHDPAFSELLKQDSAAVQAYKSALAVVELARAQILMEVRLDNYEKRLELVEATLGDPSRYITEGQATEISQAVRAIALVMSKRSGQNEYGRTWGEFYRKFGVSKYRLLPAARFDGAMGWLRDWYAELEGDTPF